MPTIVFLCNEKYEATIRQSIREAKQYLKEGQKAEWTWSCGRVRRIKVGNKAYIKRTGIEPLGYFASGYVIAAPEPEQLRLTNDNYKDLSKAYVTSFYDESFMVLIALDSIVDYDFPLTVDELRQKPQFNDANFINYGGGTAFREEYAPYLDEEWEKHSLKNSTNGKGVRQKC